MNSKKRLTSMLIIFAVVLSLMCPSIVFADQTVYTTATGTKYHSSSSCSGLNNAKAIYTDSESHAISLGLTKCTKCWSDSSGSSTGTSSGSTSGSSTRTITTSVVTTTTAAASSSNVIKLKAAKKKVKVGKKLKIKLTNNKSKVKWTLSNKRAKLTKKTNSYAVIKGIKKGNVVLKAKVNGKTYKIKIKVVK